MVQMKWSKLWLKHWWINRFITQSSCLACQAHHFGKWYTSNSWVLGTLPDGLHPPAPPVHGFRVFRSCSCRDWSWNSHWKVCFSYGIFLEKSPSITNWHTHDPTGITDTPTRPTLFWAHQHSDIEDGGESKTEGELPWKRRVLSGIGVGEGTKKLT